MPTVATPVMPLFPTNPVSIMASLTPTISTSVGAVSSTMTTSVLTTSPAPFVVPSINTVAIPISTPASLTPTVVVPSTYAVPTSVVKTAIAAIV